MAKATKSGEIFITEAQLTALLDSIEPPAIQRPRRRADPSKGEVDDDFDLEAAEISEPDEPVRVSPVRAIGIEVALANGLHEMLFQRLCRSETEWTDIAPAMCSVSEDLAANTIAGLVHIIAERGQPWLLQVLSGLDGVPLADHQQLLLPLVRRFCVDPASWSFIAPVLRTVPVDSAQEAIAEMLREVPHFKTLDAEMWIDRDVNPDLVALSTLIEFATRLLEGQQLSRELIAEFRRFPTHPCSGIRHVGIIFWCGHMQDCPGDVLHDIERAASLDSEPRVRSAAIGALRSSSSAAPVGVGAVGD